MHEKIFPGSAMTCKHPITDIQLLFLNFIENFNQLLKITQEEIEKSVGTIYSVYCGLQLQGICKVPGFFLLPGKFNKKLFWPK